MWSKKMNGPIRRAAMAGRTRRTAMPPTSRTWGLRMVLIESGMAVSCVDGRQRLSADARPVQRYRAAFRGAGSAHSTALWAAGLAAAHSASRSDDAWLALGHAILR